MTDTIYVAQKTLEDFNNINSSSLSVKDYLGLIALFLSAIVAVLIGQWLQNRKSKADRIYNNKFYIFSVILGHRHALGYSEDFVIAINQIPIVFSDNRIVIDNLKEFTKMHTTSVDDCTLKGCLNDLIIEMARDLGYPYINNQQILMGYFYPKASERRYVANDMMNSSTILSTPQEVLDKETQTDSN